MRRCRRIPSEAGTRRRKGAGDPPLQCWASGQKRKDARWFTGLPRVSTGSETKLRGAVSGPGSMVFPKLKTASPGYDHPPLTFRYETRYL
jgi:hypothetical protein